MHFFGNDNFKKEINSSTIFSIMKHWRFKIYTVPSNPTVIIYFILCIFAAIPGSLKTSSSGSSSPGKLSAAPSAVKDGNQHHNHHHKEKAGFFLPPGHQGSSTRPPQQQVPQQHQRPNGIRGRNVGSSRTPKRQRGGRGNNQLRGENRKSLDVPVAERPNTYLVVTRNRPAPVPLASNDINSYVEPIGFARQSPSPEFSFANGPARPGATPVLGELNVEPRGSGFKAPRKMEYFDPPFYPSPVIPPGHIAPVGDYFKPMIEIPSPVQRGGSGRSIKLIRYRFCCLRLRITGSQ